MKIDILEQTFKALAVFENLDRNAEEAKILLHLKESKFIENEKAYFLYIFIPIIMFRKMMNGKQVYFSDQFIIDHDGKTEIFNYNEYPLFKQIKAGVELYVSKGVSPTLILKIAGRSPEFKALNDLLLQGHEMDGARFNSVTLFPK
jgi:hypothetical protein